MRKSVKRFDSPSTSENGITNNSYHNESHPTLDYSRVQFDSYGKSRPIHTIAYKPKPKAWLSSRNMYRYLLGFLLCSFVATVVILGSLLGTDSFPFQKPYRLDEAATKPLMKRLRDAVSPESASREVKFGGAFLVLNEVYYADLSNPNSDLYKARVAEYRVRLLRSFVGTAFAPLLQNIEIAGFSSGSLRVIFELTFQMSPGQSMSDTSLRSVLESVILRNSIVDSPFYEQDIPVSSLQIWSSDLPPTTQVTTTTTAATFAPIIFTLTTPAVGPITTQRPINYTSMPTLSTTTTSLVSQQLSTVESDSDPLDIFTSFLETPSFPMCSQNSPPGCYDGVIPHCSDMGYQKTKYPNLLGHKTVDEVMAALGLFKLVESLKCHQSAHNFTCHVLQPQCESDNNATTYPLCRPFCTGVLEGCSKFFEVTDIPSKLKCSQLNDADECYQACADSDFVCNKSEFCLPMVKQCNHQFDCGPGDLSDEMGCECNGTELFLCNNTVCIPEAKHCDNVNDCGEWLDERGCECPKGMKQCATTGQCFPARKWCDKVFDCADSSDESGCICAPSDIKCQEGYCKAGDSHCNGINDCKDFSDELDCECSDLEFRCDRFLCKSYIKHWCNGRPDCDDKSDEPANCTCKAYQFKCANGQCIPIFEMCDQKPNCDDNSDELNCPCNIHEFTCPTGGCIPKEQVCDGKKQCKDGADERQNCPCKQDEFQCSDGTCTSIAQWCDGKKDCSDGSDETVGCKKVCPANFPVRCDTFLRGNVCLHGNLVCDGIADCKDNQDEQNCACKPETQMRCNDGTCKPWGVYCNGVKDCFDGSDEPVGCVCNPQNQLMCQSGECYDKRTRCDGIPMCKDKSDELNCTCAERIKLTSPEKICDKNVDCPDFSDELLCANCNTTSFVCGTIGPCVDWTKVCDGQKDCPNGDDERNCLHLYQDQNSITPNYWEYNNVGILFGLQGRNWYKVCAENIQKTLTTKDQLMRMANESCQKYFHYKRVAKFQLITDPAPAQVYVYIENPSNFAQLRLLTTLCPSRLVISMECEEVECGSRPAAPLIKTRIVGGSSTMMGKWPFYVAIFKEGKQHCGSTLINDQWVLTAAHCFNSALLQDENIWDKSGVKSPKETRNSDDLIEDDNPATSYAFVLRGGIYKSSSATPFDQFRRVTHVIRHPNYNQMTGVNDLALLKVDKPFSFSSYVMPVCMPKRREPVKPGIRCHIVGMGSLAWKFHGSEDVQEVELPVMDSSDCRKFPTINAEVRIIDSQICAGFPEGGKDTCQGDSGGPLFCQNSDGFWTLVGATSRGYACAKPLTPGVYSKVAAFLDWIYAVTNNQNLPKTNMSCPIGEFQCVYGKCVPNAKVCNGIPDCSFAEDESGCQTLTGGSTTPLPASSTGGISTTPSIVGTTGVPTGPVGPTGVTGGQSTVPSGTPTATGAVGTTAAQSSLAPGTSAIVGTTTQPAAKKKPWWLGYGK